jgi:hypothetical protein
MKKSLFFAFILISQISYSAPNLLWFLASQQELEVGQQEPVASESKPVGHSKHKSVRLFECWD